MVAKRRGREKFHQEATPEQQAPLPGKSCSGCYYFGSAYGTTVCKFNPPVVLALHNKVSTQWPWVAPADWCGKFLEATSVP